jgi:hypothetical protein
MPRPSPSPLSIELILSWAGAHRERTGQWPSTRSGAIPEAPERNWSAINVALHRGSCGLRGGDSLTALLVRRVGKSRGRREWFRLQQIEGWARSHQRRRSCWPTCRSSDVVDAPGEAWRAVDKALRQGSRGLPGGDSLARLVGRLRASKARRSMVSPRPASVAAPACSQVGAATQAGGRRGRGGAADGPDDGGLHRLGAS